MPALLVLAAALLGTPAHAAGDGHWIERSDAELSAALTAACTASLADKKPVLLEFSAPWCQDCVLLHRMAGDAPVSTELAQWHHVTAHVGRFDRHIPLLHAFGGDRIAWWVALAPTDCSTDPATWPVTRKGSLEPTSDATLRSPAAVAAWLKSARSGG